MTVSNFFRVSMRQALALAAAVESKVVVDYDELRADVIRLLGEYSHLRATDGDTIHELFTVDADAYILISRWSDGFRDSITYHYIEVELATGAAEILTSKIAFDL